jgi:uncharacterized protein YdiU (UPF0061 family)
LIPSIQCTSYLQLPADFYQEIAPTPVTTPYLIKLNHELAVFLGGANTALYNEQEALAIYAGNWVPPYLKSIALAYAGHQFGFYAPLLGDGRAVLLGEVSSNDGRVWDMQLKGSGKTAFSRTGDGRAPLAAVLREYLISEAMHGLNIPTTRCLAVVASADKIHRQSGLVPAGILTRIASSSLRVGSFEYAAYQQDHQLLKSLADYTLARHFPELMQRESPYLELFKEVMERQAYLMAQWMGVGFIHGVMNTDNMTISGETIDYGPCAFMDEFDMETVFSSIDMAGRYAFGNQASIAKWNLAQLSQTLLPLLTDVEKQILPELLNSFAARFYHYWHKKSRDKLGLCDENEQVVELINHLFALLQQYKPDFTNTFRLLSKATNSEYFQQQLLEALGNQEQSKQWIVNWLSYIKQQNVDLNEIQASMERVNPAYIPRNHLVEKAITAVVEENDGTLMDRLLLVLKNPYQQQENTQDLQCLPALHERVLQTFCGT